MTNSTQTPAQLTTFRVNVLRSEGRNGGVVRVEAVDKAAAGIAAMDKVQAALVAQAAVVAAVDPTCWAATPSPRSHLSVAWVRRAPAARVK